jgi:hypothetical protein
VAARRAPTRDREVVLGLVSSSTAALLQVSRSSTAPYRGLTGTQLSRTLAERLSLPQSLSFPYVMFRFSSFQPAVALVALALLGALQLGGACSLLGSCGPPAVQPAQASASAPASCPEHQPPPAPPVAWLAEDCCGLVAATPPIDAVTSRTGAIHVLPANLAALSPVARSPLPCVQVLGAERTKSRAGGSILLEISVLLI